MDAPPPAQLARKPEPLNLEMSKKRQRQKLITIIWLWPCAWDKIAQNTTLTLVLDPNLDMPTSRMGTKAVDATTGQTV